MINACHDLPASGGHLAFKATFDRVRDCYWWPTMQGDLQSHCTGCEACQHRKTPHRRPPLPKRSRTSRTAVSASSHRSRRIQSPRIVNMLSVIDHLTRFVILAPIRTKAATTIARVLVDRVFSVFGVPEMLHLTKVQSSKINLSESYKHFLVTSKLVPDHTGHKVIPYWSMCIVLCIIC